MQVKYLVKLLTLTYKWFRCIPDLKHSSEAEKRRMAIDEFNKVYLVNANPITMLSDWRTDRVEQTLQSWPSHGYTFVHNYKDVKYCI